MIIFGIDPGTTVTGYGIIKVTGSSYLALDYGCIRPPIKLKLSDRYLIIYNALEELMEKYQPDTVAIESQFVQKNVQSAIKLGMARGIAMIAAKKRGISVFEYAPLRAKKAVVGMGNASKQQVQAMMKSLLNLATIPTPEDAADALALAICHAQTAKIPGMKTTEM